MGTVLFLNLFLMTFIGVESKFKSLHCNVYDQKVGEFPICRIKALNRYRNTISVTYRTKKFQDKILVRLEFFKRANGWRPFLYNITFNVCNFLDKRNHFFANVAFSYLEPYLKLNYTCPLKINDTIICEGFELDFDTFRIRFPIDTGEYAVRMGFYYKEGVKISINGSVEYSNYREH